MNVQESKQIIDDFAQKLAERQFLGEEYIVYIFSLSENIENCFISLEAFRATMNFDESNGYPIPCSEGDSLKLKVTFKSYQRYKYSRGGNRCPFDSIVKDHRNKGGKTFIRDNSKKYRYWKDKHVYFCGYQFEGKHLVIVLVFDFDPDQPSGDKEKRSDQKAEKELISIYLNPILRRVEDTYHKKCIFNEDYLRVLQDKIDNKLFKPVNDSIKDLNIDYEHTHYLQRIYYDFLIENFSIYNQLSPLHQEKLLILAREFEKNQKNLFRIRNYRDHFLHQFNVYIIGIAVISIINSELKNDIVEDFNLSYSPISRQVYKEANDVSLMWFLTSMFHDIAYPVEKCGAWLDSFFQEYIYRKGDNSTIVETDINISNMIYDVEYNSCIEELAEYHRKLNFRTRKINYKNITEESNVNKGCEVRSQILDQTIRRRDHGILSAIMILHKFRREKKIFRFLFPAAAAISIHNFMWIDKNFLKDPCNSCPGLECEKCNKWNEAYDKYFEDWIERNKNISNRDQVEELRYISYKKNPLGFLLFLCDLLQDWGRHLRLIIIPANWPE
jgi:hypothetical protein